MNVYYIHFIYKGLRIYLSFRTTFAHYTYTLFIDGTGKSLRGIYEKFVTSLRGATITATTRRAKFRMRKSCYTTGAAVWMYKKCVHSRPNESETPVRSRKRTLI